MKKGIYLLVSVLVILVDQSTKYWAKMALFLFQSREICPMFNLTLAYNTGAAFSFLSHLQGLSHWIFIGFTLIVSIGVLMWGIKTPREEKAQLFALSLIFGGAMGNLIDRLNTGYVIDFIDVYYKTYHWPIFNFADCAITLGTCLLIFNSVRR